MNALILSAGFGTRFRPQTDRVAKAALPFLNVPLLGYPLHYIEGLNIERVVFNLHHLPDTVKAAASSLTQEQSYEIVYSVEKPEILDSGGGIGKARSLLSGSGDFVVANADSLFLLSHNDGLQRLLKQHQKQKALATILTCDYPGIGRDVSAVWTADDGYVHKFGIDKDEKKLTPRHYMGVMIVSDAIFKYIPKGASKIFNDVMMTAIAQNEKVCVYHEPNVLWFETGNIKDYFVAQDKCFELLTGPANPHRKSLTKILSRYFPQFSFSKKGPWVMPSVRIPPKQLQSKKVLVGSSVKIDAGIVLQDGVCLTDGTVLSGAGALQKIQSFTGAQVSVSQETKDTFL